MLFQARLIIINISFVKLHNTITFAYMSFIYSCIGFNKFIYFSIL